MGITVGPKATAKKYVKPKTMHLQAKDTNSVKIYAKDSFWDAWRESHFDLNLIRAFYRAVAGAKKDEVLKVTDGKSVIVGMRESEKKAVLTSGRVLSKVYSEDWAKANNYIYTPHRQVRLGVDHKEHFIKRYKERSFDLGLVCEFITKAPMAKLGQRIKIVGEHDIVIGTRTTEYGSMLISGMVRGEIDMLDYVDYTL